MGINSLIKNNMANQYENMGSSHKVKPEDKDQDLVYSGEHKFGQAAGMIVDMEDPEEIKNLTEEE